MGYTLSHKSEIMMRGVKPALVAVVRRAIELTTRDFKVGEGLRSQERQFMLAAQGDNTRTKNSKHLTGDAVDLWALVDNSVTWDWEEYYKIAGAMRQSAQELDTRIRWGGVWDRLLNDLSGNLEDEVKKYKIRFKKLHPDLSILLDGPHFELAD